MKKKLTLKGYHFSPNRLPKSDDYIFIIINGAGHMSIQIKLSESPKPHKVATNISAVDIHLLIHVCQKS